MRQWMSWVMGGVIGEGKVGGKELSVRNNDGRMLSTNEVKNTTLYAAADIPFKLARPCAMCIGAIPIIS